MFRYAVVCLLCVSSPALAGPVDYLDPESPSQQIIKDLCGSDECVSAIVLERPALKDSPFSAYFRERFLGELPNEEMLSIVCSTPAEGEQMDLMNETFEKNYIAAEAEATIDHARETLGFVIAGLEQRPQTFTHESIQGLHWILMDIDNMLKSACYRLTGHVKAEHTETLINLSEARDKLNAVTVVLEEHNDFSVDNLAGMIVVLQAVKELLY